MPPKSKPRTPARAGDKPKDARYWIEIQKRTFCAWFNSVLVKRPNAPQMTDCVEDMKDGVMLGIVLEVLTKERFDRPATNASRLVTMDYINKLLVYLRTSGVRVTCSAEEVAAGNEKMTLGLVWSVIKYFQFHSVEEEDKNGSSLKQAMMTWLKEELAKYNIPMSNFTTSFSDGQLLCALAHEYAPGSVDMKKINNLTPEDRIKLAFGVAEKDLGIPQLLDVNDLLEGGDEQSMLTYLSYFRIYSREKKLQNQQEMTMDQLKERYASVTRDLQTTQDMLTSVRARLQAAEDRNGFLEQKYFFASALGIKLNEQLLGRKTKDFDLAEMWDNIQKDHIPAEQWPRYLSARVVYAYQDGEEPEPEPEPEKPAEPQQEQEEKMFEHLGPAIAMDMLDGQFADRQILGNLITRWGAENGPALTIIRGKSSSNQRLPTVNLPWRIIDRVTKSLSALLVSTVKFDTKTAVLPIILPSSHSNWRTELILLIMSCWRVGIAPCMMYLKNENLARDLAAIESNANLVGVLGYCYDNINCEAFKEVLTPYKEKNVMLLCSISKCGDKLVESFPYVVAGVDAAAHLVPTVKGDCGCLCAELGFGVCINKMVYEACAISESYIWTAPAVEAAPLPAAEPEAKTEEDDEPVEAVLTFEVVPKERADAILLALTPFETAVTSASPAMVLLTSNTDACSLSVYSHRALTANSLVLARSFSMETQDTMLLDAAPNDACLALASQLVPGLFLGSRFVVVGDGMWSELGLGAMRALREGKPTVWVTKSTHIAHLLSQPGWSPTAEELGSLRVLVVSDGAAPAFNSSLCSRVLVRAMHNKTFAIAAADANGVCGMIAYRLVINKHDVELWEKAGGVVPGVLTIKITSPDETGKGKVSATGPQVVERIISSNFTNNTNSVLEVEDTETEYLGHVSEQTKDELTFTALKLNA